MFFAIQEDTSLHALPSRVSWYVISVVRSTVQDTSQFRNCLCVQFYLAWLDLYVYEHNSICVLYTFGFTYSRQFVVRCSLVQIVLKFQPDFKMWLFGTYHFGTVGTNVQSRKRCMDVPYYKSIVVWQKTPVSWHTL